MKKFKWTKGLFIVLVFAMIGSSLFAVTTGKITGIVKDAADGEPLAGINVLLQNTMLGAATDEDGRYFILNVPVGTYSIRATAIGYKAMTVNGVFVTIDHTTTINVDMESTVLEGEEITVTAERKLIQLDNTATKTFISGADITSVPSGSFTDLVSLEAGAVGGNVRGGRASGTIYYIDGVSLRNPFTGYAGQTTGFSAGPNTDVSLNVDLPEFAFDEVEMLTGGYSPEFGNAQDAVINIATLEGRSKHTGRLRITDEGSFLTGLQSIDEKEWYIDAKYVDNTGLSHTGLILAPDDSLTDSYGVKVAVKGGRLMMDGTEYDAAGIDQIHKDSELSFVKGRRAYTNSTPIWTDERGAYKSRKYSFNMAGPLMAGAHYAISGEYLDRSQGLYENQSRNNFNILAKLTYNMSSKTKLNLSVLSSKQEYGIYNYNYAKFDGGYLPSYGPLYSTLDMLPDRFKNSLLLTGVLTHSLSANSYLTVTFGSYNSEYESKRKDYDDRDGDGDRDEYLIYKKIDVKSGNPDSVDYKVEKEYRYTTEGGDLVYIWTQNPTKLDSNHANYDAAYAGEWKIGNEDLMAGNDTWTEANPVGWKEIWHAEYDLNTETWSWTSQWLFVNGDNEREELGVAHDDLDEKIFQITDSWFGAYGDAYAYSNMKSTVNTMKVDYSSQIHPVHFIQAGAEMQLYSLDVINLRAFSISNFYLDEYDVTPTEWGLYFRDKIEMGGLIVNAGLRFDSYNLGDDIEYSAVADDPSKTPVDEFGEIVEPVKWKDEVGAKIYISPRLGISHPITDRDVLHFSYNHFLQRPDWRYYFENLSYSKEGAYEEIGNPELEPQRTVSYEVGFTHQFTDNMKVDLTAYYKDIFGWVQQSKGGDLTSTHFWYYDNADFGSAKGFEVALDKRMSNNFSLDINYTYLIASGRLSDPGMGGTYLWRKLISPREVHFLDYDQTHTVSAKFAYYIPASKNPLLGDWLINVTERYGSGLPYDSQDRASADVIPPENDKRMPYTNVVDLRIQKRFSYNKTGIAAFVEVFNVLNRDNTDYSPEFIPDNAEWYQSEEDLDGNGVADHLLDPEGRRHDWTVWAEPRRVKAGIEINW